jgi:RNA polymerase sigma factor (sigma-70 family)
VSKEKVSGVRTDRELVHASLDGDRSAFGALIDRHRLRAVTIAHGLLRNRDDADDVVQEAVLQAYLGLGRLRDADAFGAWLGGITVNLARMRLRARRDVAPSLDDGGRVVPESFEASVLDELDSLRKLGAALEPLPASERDAVLMHYVDGLTAQEIAALLGERAGTVRVRLHRARERLRQRLSPTRRELEPMVEVTVDDVVVRVLKDVPEGETRLANERLRVVLLKEEEGDRVLPIWVGPPEGDALALQLGGESMPRPMTADLMARLIEATGARIERVVVSSLREKTFYASVGVRTRDGITEVDARPSDALNLAVRVGAPIYVDPELMEGSGIASADASERMVALESEWLKGEDLPEEPTEWRSVSPEFVKALYPALGRK